MKRIAIYPGTFDPITNGHLDLIERASKIFDLVIVAISANPKKSPLFDLAERIELSEHVTSKMDNVLIEGFDELLIDYVSKKGAAFLIRGLRAVSDFEYEFQMASTNRRLNPNVETIFLTPNEPNYFTSSSLVREISFYGGDVSSFVSPYVEEALAEKRKKGQRKK